VAKAWASKRQANSSKQQAASQQSTEIEHVKHTHTHTNTTSPCHEAMAPSTGARAAQRRAPYTMAYTPTYTA